MSYAAAIIQRSLLPAVANAITGQRPGISELIETQRPEPRAELKIIVGAGGTSEPGWLSLNQSDLDVTDPEQWARRFPLNSVDAVLAEHVWEHLTPQEAIAATRNVFAWLRPGGCFRVAVPDGLHPNGRYRAWVMPGTGFNGDDHKILFDYQSLSALLVSTGFIVNLMEFFDERGCFHSCLYDQQDGVISRSVWNTPGLVSLVVGARYTSLVADGIKP